MKVLITGHDGYIGSVLTPMVRDAGHEVAGLDAFLFEGCALGPEPDAVPDRRVDVRDVEIDHLRGFDAVVHLAALSNDPLGSLDPARTFEINHMGSARMAHAAKRAGGCATVIVASFPCERWNSTSLDRSTSETPSPYVSMKVSSPR